MNAAHASSATRRTPELETVQPVGFMAMTVIFPAWMAAIIAWAQAAPARTRVATRVAIVAAPLPLAAVTIASPHWPAAVVIAALGLRGASPMLGGLTRRASARSAFPAASVFAATLGGSAPRGSKGSSAARARPRITRGLAVADATCSTTKTATPTSPARKSGTK